MGSSFDIGMFHLGGLCKRGHDYNGTGKSLRFISIRTCVDCSRLYRVEHKQELSQKKKIYYIKNKMGIKKKRQSLYIKNKDKISEQHRRYYAANAQIIINKQMLYYQNNKGKIVARQIIYERRQRENNSQSAIRHKLRKRVNDALLHYTLTGKIRSSIKYGIDYAAIIAHLGPHPNTVGVKGKYDIDHIIPLSSFNLNNSEQIKLAFAPGNHQWLLMRDNRSKNNKISGQLHLQTQHQLRAVINVAR